MSDETSENLALSSQKALEHFEKRDAVFVDVREPQEWLGGCIPHAFLLPLSALSSGRAEGSALMATLDALDAPIIVYCHAGVRSLTGATLLRQMLDRQDVYSMDGGIMGWAGPSELPPQLASQKSPKKNP